MENNLQLLGLTPNEIEIYQLILRLGKCSATEIRKETGIANSRVYTALDSLIKKGIITYEKHPNVKKYIPLDPEILKKIMEDRTHKIEKTIPLLKQLYKKEKKPTETAVYEGIKGFKTALYRLVEECPKGETIKIIGFSNQAYKNEKLATLLNEINRISARKKHKFKMILDNKNNKFYSQRKEEKISTIKFMGNGFSSPAAIDIFQDKVFILLWDENPYAFVIKNQNIANGFSIYFDFLWNMAKY